MAHKIGLVLLASMHLMNAQIAPFRNNGAGIEVHGHALPIVSIIGERNERHSEDDRGALLGLNKVTLGNSLLREANSVGDHDDHHEVRIIKVQARERSGKRENSGRRANSGRKEEKRENSGRKEERRENSGRKEERRENSGRKEERSARREISGRKEERREKSARRENSGRKEERSARREISGRKEERTEKRERSQEKPAKIILNVIKKVEKVEKKEEKEYQHKPIDVNKTPVNFKSLRYVDNDEHGEAEKAPITIVTVPLVANRDDDHHRVAINENIGRANYHQIKGKDAPLNKYDDLLKVKVEGPIKHLEVPTEELRSEISVDKRKVKRTVRKDTKGEKIVNASVRRDIIEGEKLEHAPFVVGKVVLAETKHEEHTDDGHHRHENNSRREDRHENDSRREVRHEKDSRREDRHENDSRKERRDNDSRRGERHENDSRRDDDDKGKRNYRKHE